jgi:hypothetical protein
MKPAGRVSQGTAKAPGLASPAQRQEHEQEQEQGQQQQQQQQTGIAEAASSQPRASFPHGVLASGTLVPTVRKLPFLALGLVSLAIVLLALGALPATAAAAHPIAARLLADHRRELALGGLATLVASIAAYLLA